MITIKNITKNIEHIVKPTVFPDGTQQVWKLPEEILDIGKFQIIWHYENDAELIILMQLVSLIRTIKIPKQEYVKFSGDVEIELVIPFLPYGRQDKTVSNETTFGLTSFKNILGMLDINKIVTYDVHNWTPFQYHKEWVSMAVNNEVRKALLNSGADLVCFPDKGATTRGYVLNRGLKGESIIVPSFHLSKTRDQLTGAITGMICDLPLNLEGKTVLIVDDICDGGKTFKEATKVLKGMGAAKVCLYVTHGIFSQGVQTLLAGGIDHIYTTDSFKTKATLTEQVTVFKLEI